MPDHAQLESRACATAFSQRWPGRRSRRRARTLRQLSTACVIEHPLRLTVLAADCQRPASAENPAAPRGRQIGLPRGAGPGRQPPQARRPAVRAGRRLSLRGGCLLCHGGGRLRARAPRARHRARRPARHRRPTPGCAEDEDRLYRAAAEVAAATQRCLAARTRRVSLLHHQCGRDGSGARARGARLPAHQPLRRLLWHASRSTTCGAFRPGARLDLDGGGAAAAGGRTGHRAGCAGALRRILARCAAAAACRARFGNRRTTTRRCAWAAAARVPVALPDPPRERQHLDFNLDHLGACCARGPAPTPRSCRCCCTTPRAR